MNPRLVKFAVELQNGEKCQKEKKDIHFTNSGGKKLFDFLKTAKVTVPIKNN